jgi:Right handed beta helix region
VNFSIKLIAALGLFTTALSGFAQEDLFAHLRAGEWRELPNTKLESVFPDRANHPAWGIMGPQAVVAAWSGAIFDIKRNVLVVTGGGHTDYGGNEVYEFDLKTLRWTRVTEPSALKPLAAPGRFEVVGSEAPVSSHTYDGLVYLPKQDKMFKFGGSYYKSGDVYDRHAYLFDLETKTWQRGAEAPIHVLQVNSDLDPKTNRVIIGTGGSLMFYDPIADSWKKEPERDASVPASVGALDPDNRLFVQILAPTSQINFYDLDNPTPRQKAPIQGDADWGKRPGLAYHAPSKRMVVWDGGREVWSFATRDWVVRKFLNPNGPAPFPFTVNGNSKSAGVYGRWQYAPDHDVFIAYNSTSENVWLYKLPPVDHKEKATGKSCGADICVGPSRRFTKPSEAAVSARDGQTILIDAGDYTGDVARWSKNNLTIRGNGGRPHIDANGKNIAGKGTWLVTGNDMTIENVEFSGAKVTDRNGAGIRLEGKNLTLRNCYFHHNENGILTGANESSDIVIENSEFAFNGAGDGQSHNIYVGRVRSLTVKFSHLHHAKVGHNLKSRALTNQILYNFIADEADGDASYEVNLPNGGRAFLIGNIIQQGPKTENDTIISYGEEGLEQGPHQFYLVNNTIINDGPRTGQFIRLKQGSEPGKFINNIFVGPGKLPLEPGKLGSNLATDKSIFVAAERYDYRLKPGTKAINMGIDPDEPIGVNLVPKFQYVHPMQSKPRKIEGALDLGAFEY